MSIDPRSDQVADLMHRFSQPEPSAEQAVRIAKVRVAIINAALIVAEFTLPSREQSLAFTALEDAAWRARDAIVHEPENPVPNWVDCDGCGRPRSVNASHPDHAHPPYLCEVCTHNAEHPDDLLPVWTPEGDGPPADPPPSPAPAPEEIPGQVTVEDAVADVEGEA